MKAWGTGKLRSNLQRVRVAVTAGVVKGNSGRMEDRMSHGEFWKDDILVLSKKSGGYR